MLQQTTVAAVRGRYGAFLARFPDVASLARARQRACSPPGPASATTPARATSTRRRADSRRAARRPPAARPGGPARRCRASASTWRRPSPPSPSARACPRPTPTSTRVVSRLFAIDGVAGTRRARRRGARPRRCPAPGAAPGDLTAALMDLGQLICPPRRPDCAACPVSRSLRRLRDGDADALSPPPNEAPPAPRSRRGRRRREGADASCSVRRERRAPARPLALPRGRGDLSGRGANARSRTRLARAGPSPGGSAGRRHRAPHDREPGPRHPCLPRRGARRVRPDTGARPRRRALAHAGSPRPVGDTDADSPHRLGRAWRASRGALLHCFELRNEPSDCVSSTRDVLRPDSGRRRRRTGEGVPAPPPPALGLHRRGIARPPRAPWTSSGRTRPTSSCSTCTCPTAAATTCSRRSGPSPRRACCRS